MKKTIAFILVLALVLSMGIATAFAADPEYNGDIAGIITSDAGGNITGSVSGAYDLTITGMFTGPTVNQRTPFTATISGGFSGTVTGSVCSNGLDSLYGVITGTGASDPVRIVGCFLQSGIPGDFAGEIITGALPDPVTSLTITAAGDATTVAAGNTLQMSAITTPAGPYDVLWSVWVDDADKATIDQNGLLIGLQTGTITVIANTLDPGLATATKTITVVEPETEVKAGVDPTYIIMIPSSVDFGTLVKDSGIKTKDFIVSAQSVLIEDDAKIDVNVNAINPMMAGTNSLTYILKNSAADVAEHGLFAEFEGDDTEAGTVRVDTDAIVAAGSYSGTMVFGISYVSP